MKRYLAAILSLGAVAISALTFIGCPSTTETKIEHDTITTYVHDSTRVAFVRFVSLMPDNSAIILKQSKNSTAIYASTTSQTTSSYVPFIPDSSLWLFLFNGNTFLDSIQVAGTQLRKGSINTFGLFENQSHIQFAGGGNNDSIKQKPIANGYAMVRFINGDNWHTGSQQIGDLYVESALITTSGFGQAPGNYVQISAGSHKLTVMKGGTSTPADGLVPSNGVFESGLFYTVRLVGDADHPAQLWVDGE